MDKKKQQRSGSRGIAGWGSYRLDELVYSGEVKRQPKRERQSKSSKAEEGQEEGDEEEGWEDTDPRGTSSWDPPCSECLPLTPTLKCDGGNDAAAAAAVVAVRPPSSPLTGRGVPGRVVLGEARRIDDEAQLCISWVVKTIWESTTQTGKHVSLVATSLNRFGTHPSRAQQA